MTTTLSTGCNSLFDIHEGKAAQAIPPSAATGCQDPSNLLIDDMEDGVGDICNLSLRQGYWYSVGDGTSTTLNPAEGASFNPTVITGGRGTSQYAARLTGSGFKDWGALMGFALGTVRFANQPYDASTTGGITFWMKSNVPVNVGFPIPETIPVSDSGGTCVDSATNGNCDNHFGFHISAPNPDAWVQYKVPYTALTQYGKVVTGGNLIPGSATWNPARIVSIQFVSLAGSDGPSPGRAFDTWVDDVAFYYCAGASCVPTCSDPYAPVACPALGTAPAGCWAAGTDCSMVPELYTLSFPWGSAADDVWAVGYRDQGHSAVILHWNGSVWSWFPTNVAYQSLYGVWGSGPSDVWAVGGSGTIIHWDGTAWSASSSGTSAALNSVWGSGPNDVWAVAGNGTILHWNGSAWAPSTSGTSQFLGLVWGTGPGDAWAVGDGGTILHWNGSAWSPKSSGTTEAFSGVWGTRSDDVWAVGDGGTILHWNGSAWSASASGTNQLILNAWGSGPSDVWAVGDRGAILHWDGISWSSAASPTTNYLAGVWGSGPNDVWAVGDPDTIVHWDGAAWSLVPGVSAP